MNRFSYFQADKRPPSTLRAHAHSRPVRPRRPHTPTRQDLQSTASSGIFTYSPPGWSVFGHKPPPSLTTAHSPSLPGAFAPARSHDQSVLSVFSPSSRSHSTEPAVHQTHATRQHHWSLCGPLSCQPARAPPSCASPQPACRSLSAGYTKPHSQ